MSTHVSFSVLDDGGVQVDLNVDGTDTRATLDAPQVQNLVLEVVRHPAHHDLPVAEVPF